MVEEEYFPLNIPAEYRNLEAESLSFTIREIWNRFLDGNLVVEPDFQRHYIWDARRSSLYIESLLTGLPTPSIFVAEETDGRWVVVDGHQRLGSLFRFMRPLLREAPPSFVPPTPLKLNGMEVLSELNGRDITALSIDDRIRLWDTPLSFNLIPKTAHKDMKYVMFARLNQGSVSLNPQELRNCLYRGSYNRLIAELSESRDFLRLWGKSEADKRMKDRERVLTFFALMNRRDRYRTPFRNFLNDEMEENQDIQAADATKFSREFQNALKWVERVFTTQQCFRRFEIGNAEHPPGRWIQRRMDLIHDVELVGFGVFGDMLDLIYDFISESDKRTFLNMLRNRLVSVMTSPNFKEAFQSGGTRQPRNQQTRLEMWLKSLDTTILNYEQIIKDGHRLEDLINRLPDCTACSYQVSWDDAVIRNRRVIHRY